MHKWWLLLLICLVVVLKVNADTPVKIRRICVNGLNNDLFFNPSSDPCNNYFQYKVWGRIGAFGAFSLIDSIVSKGSSQYTHINANVGGTKTWAYYISIIDSCGPNFETISDTVVIDRTPPQIITIDSVSINPLTNTVLVGWSGNRSPDFSYFKLYSIKATNVPILPFNKDTSYTGLNQINDSLRFDLSSVDSCGLETVFELNQHVSMYLQVASDTCLRKNNLIWTPYIGWKSIKKYYLYRQTGSGLYMLIDSVSSSIRTYIDTITLGIKYSYYIRAIKDTSFLLSASSNSDSVITRYRKEPINSYISSVSIDQPFEQNITVNIYNPFEEVSKYQILTSQTLNGSYAALGTIDPASSLISNYSRTLPFDYQHKYIKVLALTACGDIYPSTNISKYSILSLAGQNTILWEPYFTWNVGISFYRIYRGTTNSIGNIVYALIDSVPSTDTFYVDKNIPTTIGEDGLCYYVEAVQNPGDVNFTIESSFSNHACVIGAPTIFIPNAFHPGGANKTFRPEGLYIDYGNSRMEIYDRWGRQLVNQYDIRNGWDGKDSDNINCMQGVYYYKIYLKNTNGSENVFIGFVTLLD